MLQQLLWDELMSSQACLLASRYEAARVSGKCALRRWTAGASWQCRFRWNHPGLRYPKPSSRNYPQYREQRLNVGGWLDRRPPLWQWCGYGGQVLWVGLRRDWDDRRYLVTSGEPSMVWEYCGNQGLTAAGGLLVPGLAKQLRMSTSGGFRSRVSAFRLYTPGPIKLTKFSGNCWRHGFEILPQTQLIAFSVVAPLTRVWVTQNIGTR